VPFSRFRERLDASATFYAGAGFAGSALRPCPVFCRSLGLTLPRILLEENVTHPSEPAITALAPAPWAWYFLKLSLFAFKVICA